MKKLMDMSNSELTIFRNLCSLHPIIAGRVLFPDRPKGYVKVVKSLGLWAINKECGNLYPSAVVPLQDMSPGTYSKIADEIKASLPAYALRLFE